MICLRYHIFYAFLSGLCFNFLPYYLCLVLQANILHAKHGWDIAILYSHKHARGDTVQGYGTPGIGAMFIGKEKSKVSEAGRAAWNLFEKFADRKYFYNVYYIKGMGYSSSHLGCK